MNSIQWLLNAFPLERAHGATDRLAHDLEFSIQAIDRFEREPQERPVNAEDIWAYDFIPESAAIRSTAGCSGRHRG